MSKPATELDWDSQITNRFRPSEWPDGTLQHMGAHLLLAVSDVRAALPSSHAMIPSPALNAHVRHDDPGSYHNTDGQKQLSRATDLFMDNWDHAMRAFYEALQHPQLHGIGLYIGTWMGSRDNIMPMLHLDIRSYTQLWVAHRDRVQDPLEYVMLNTHPRKFHSLLGEALQ